MGLRFRRSLKLMPGLRLNLGLRGLSLTAGPRGASVNIGSRGVFRNLGLPGTGISFRERLDAPASEPTSNMAKVVVKLSLDDNGRLHLADAEGLRLDAALERRIRRDEQARLKAWLLERCVEIDAGFAAIEGVHLDTPAPGSRAHFVPSPFPDSEPQPPDSPTFGFWDKLFRGRRLKRERAHRDEQESYERRHAEWRTRFDAHIEQQAVEQQRVETLIRTDVSIMEDGLERAWSELSWPRETKIDFALEESGARLVVEVDLPEIEDLPVRDAEVAARGLKLNIRERTATQLRRAYAAHVHGVAFRVVGTAFAELPALREVVCSGYSQRMDQAVGEARDEYLFSVRVERQQWSSIDFDSLDQLDVSTSLEAFELVQDLTGKAHFSRIEPLARLAGFGSAGTNAKDSGPSAGED